MNELLAQIVSILRGMWKYRWVGMMVAWPILIVGLAVIYKLPNKFDASARVQVDTQTILKPLLGGMTVLPDPEQQVALMSRTLLSRPNLEKLVRQADIDLRARTTQDRDQLVDEVRASLRLSSGRAKDLYTISYRHENPATAQRVVQALLNMFVEQSLGDTKKDTEAARRFLDQQLKAYEERVLAAEERIKAFKFKHLGQIPGSGGGDFFSRIQEAGAKTEQARRDLREAESSRDEIRKQLVGESTTVEGRSVASPAAPPPPPIEIPTKASPALEGRIEAMRKQLDELMVRYTNEHPDVRAAKRLLAQLEAQRDEELVQLRARAEEARAKAVAAAKAGVVDPTVPTTSANIVYQQLRLSLAEAESNVAVKKARLRAYETDEAQLRTRAKSLAAVEHEFNQLNREHEAARQTYQRLLASRNKVDVSEEIDASAQLVDFRVIEPPRVSPKPVWPNRVQFASIVFGAALAAGLALTLLLSQIRPAFFHTRPLREMANRPLLGTVSMVWSQRQKHRQRIGKLAFAVSCLAFVGVFGGGLAYFLLRGPGSA
jgi:polysaccharide chain length determinant protein (PEP-CTERM system associated)